MTYDEIFQHALEKHDLTTASRTRQNEFLMRHFGLTARMLADRRGKEATATGISDLVERHADHRVDAFLEESIEQIIEYFPLEAAESNGSALRIFSIYDEDEKEVPFYAGLKRQLEDANGVYIYYDSRGRAIYVGKAHGQSLWKEMNLAYNRGREAVQHLKIADYPTTRGTYSLEKARRVQIAKRSVYLHHIAHYFSAYRVPKPMISKIEGLLVRAFANDLLNIRMEKI